MTIHYTKLNQNIVIMGKTYNHRLAFQEMGARFNYQEKTWMLPYSDLNLKEIDKLCRAAGGGPLEDFKPEFEENNAETTTATVIEIVGDKPQVFTIQQVVNRVSSILLSEFPLPIWITGEIQSLNHRGKGIYFNLSEPKEANTSGTLSINAVIWSDGWKIIQRKHGEKEVNSVLQEGIKIQALCKLSLYRDRGSLTLSILDIDPSYTKGALALARQKVLQELKLKKLDRLNKELQLTSYPFHVGLISAKNSRAYSDFIDQLFEQKFPGTISFYSASMQGQNTTKEILAALKALQKQRVDVIVLTRGGGSAADLRWFDDLQLCVAACQCPIPIIAAIGHHDDTSVLEMIAFQQQKTPTAAAEFLLRIFQNSKDAIDQLEQTIIKKSRQTIDDISDDFADLREKFIAVTQNKLTGAARIIDRIANQLKLNTVQFFANAEKSLQLLQLAIAKHDPRQWLEQGWIQLQSGKEKIKSIKQLTIHQILSARLLDGKVTLQVMSKEGKEKK